MDILIKSSVGKSFQASLDPVFVQRLLDLAVGDAEQRKMETISNDVFVAHAEYSSKDESAVRLELSDSLRQNLSYDSYAPSVLEAWREFYAEFKLLDSGAGDDKTCMGAFMELCELLQG